MAERVDQLTDLVRAELVKARELMSELDELHHQASEQVERLFMSEERFDAELGFSTAVSNLTGASTLYAALHELADLASPERTWEAYLADHKRREA